MVKYTPTEVKTVEPGRHTGKVLSVTPRLAKEKFAYVDIEVSVDGFEDMSIKVSCPENVGIQNGKPVSKFAVVMSNLGVDVTSEFEADSVVGTEVKYNTTENITANGTFAEIDYKSLLRK